MSVPQSPTRWRSCPMTQNTGMQSPGKKQCIPHSSCDLWHNKGCCTGDPPLTNHGFILQTDEHTYMYIQDIVECLYPVLQWCNHRYFLFQLGHPPLTPIPPPYPSNNLQARADTLHLLSCTGGQSCHRKHWQTAYCWGRQPQHGWTLNTHTHTRIMNSCQ